jgi:hypothetical protein
MGKMSIKKISWDYMLKLWIGLLLSLICLNGVNNFLRYSQIDGLLLNKKGRTSFLFHTNYRTFDYENGWEQQTWEMIHRSEKSVSK